MLTQPVVATLVFLIAAATGIALPPLKFGGTSEFGVFAR
jgi:hypothetical protein